MSFKEKAMISNDFESRLRGMFAKEKLAESVIKQVHIPSATQDTCPINEADAHKSTRSIIRQWPRNPDGPILTLSAPGKVAGNNQPLWGATVLDFYWVRRNPRCPLGETLSTGSKLYDWAKRIGEIAYAKDEIKWAELEAEPQELLPYDLSLLISDQLKKTDCDTRVSACEYPQMRTRIPFHLFPERLIVHDPDDTLCVTRYKRPADERGTPRLFRLHLSGQTQDAIAKDREAQASQDRQMNGEVYQINFESSVDAKTYEEPLAEPIFSKYPPAPPELLTVQEAHLYIEQSDRLGKGNHSYVYRATWEIPRSIVIKPYVCCVCRDRAVIDALRREVPEVEVNETCQDAISQIKFLLSAIAEKKDIPTNVKVVETSNRGLALEIPTPDKSQPPKIVVFSLPSRDAETTYDRPTREIPIDVKWTTPGNFCEHEVERNESQTATCKVQVAAKLSIKHDTHLAREAECYQKFPAHFFQHWSGYNVVPPIMDPTPAHAIVPQFYGYYVPDKSQTTRDGEYISPIMLIEDCGRPVDIDTLSIDQRFECAALLHRMHSDGWIHNSLYPRNILVQYGDITVAPAHRKKSDVRFRLIDFGRSRCIEDSPICFAQERAGEEFSCQQLFKIMNGIYF